jgi:amidase
MSDELCELEATALLALMAAEATSSVEVMAAHLARIERVNPRLNAIVTLVADQAREARGGP